MHLNENEKSFDTQVIEALTNDSDYVALYAAILQWERLRNFDAKRKVGLTVFTILICLAVIAFARDTGGPSKAKLFATPADTSCTIYSSQEASEIKKILSFTRKLPGVEGANSFDFTSFKQGENDVISVSYNSEKGVYQIRLNQLVFGEGKDLSGKENVYAEFSSIEELFQFLNEYDATYLKSDSISFSYTLESSVLEEVADFKVNAEALKGSFARILAEKYDFPDVQEHPERYQIEAHVKVTVDVRKKAGEGLKVEFNPRYMFTLTHSREFPGEQYGLEYAVISVDKVEAEDEEVGTTRRVGDAGPDPDIAHSSQYEVDFTFFTYEQDVPAGSHDYSSYMFGLGPSPIGDVILPNSAAEAEWLKTLSAISGLRGMLSEAMECPSKV